MNNLAIIGGSGFKTFSKKGVVFLPRHGNNKPPHKINHKKNILSLKKRGVKNIIGVCSVGSLKIKIKPGSIVAPHDYINFFNVQTYFDKIANHVTPEMSESLHKIIINTAKKEKIPIITKGVYFHAVGPRFETKAEINMIKQYADIIGMTMANEATLAQELGINYAAICTVDNYANGLTKKPLNLSQVQKMQSKNKEKVIKILNAIL